MNKYLTLMVAVLLTGFVSCAEDTEDETPEQETTNTEEQMKVVQPVVDSAHEAAEGGDSSLMNEDNK